MTIFTDMRGGKDPSLTSVRRKMVDKCSTSSIVNVADVNTLYTLQAPTEGLIRASSSFNLCGELVTSQSRRQAPAFSGAFSLQSWDNGKGSH
jgi:hypothetical protein